MSENRDNADRPLSTEPSAVKIEPVRNLAGGALVRAIPAGQPARLMMTTQVQATGAALIGTPSSVQVQTVSKIASAQAAATATASQQTVSRVSALPIQPASGTGFHVPRGAAAVANIAVPRSSSVATPIIRGQAALQTIGVPSTHSIAGAVGASSAIQVGRSVVGNVSPWAVSAISTGSAVVRQQQIRAPLQPITESLAPEDTSTSPDPFPDDEKCPDGAKIVASVSGQQIRPHPDSQRPLLVHSTTTHKQVTLTQAQVQVGQGESKNPTLLKSYRGANQSAPAARVVSQSTPGLSRISSATMPQAMVTLHPAAVLVNSSQAIPIKSATPQTKVLAQPAPSAVQFSPVPVSSVQSALTISTSRPGVVTVMLAGTSATASTLGVTPIRPQQPSQTTGQQQTGSPQLSSPVFIQTQNLQPAPGVPQTAPSKPQQLPAGTLIVREQRPPLKEESAQLSSSGGASSTSSSAAAVIGLPTYSLSGGSYYEASGFQVGVTQRASAISSVSTATSTNTAISTAAISTVTASTNQPMPQHRPTPIPLPSTTANQRSANHSNEQSIQSRSVPISYSSSSDGTLHSHADLLKLGALSHCSTGLLSESISASGGLSSHLQLKNTSPRPSILRKREPDGSPLKGQKNLTPILTSLAVSTSSQPSSSGPSGSGSPLGPSSPKRPESGNSGQSSSSSNGSTTISANSSPGESPTAGVIKSDERANEDDQQLQQRTSSLVAAAAAVVASQHRHQQSSSVGGGSLGEMSPRKKPRKQQLTGNQIPREPNFNEAEMEFISEDRMKKVTKDDHADEEDKTLPKSRMPLLKTYRHPWRGRHNHFLRACDIKPKDDKKSVSLTEYANQKHAIQKLNGWKVYHIASQMEDMISYESGYSDTYEDLLNSLESLQKKCKNRDMEKDFHRVCERVRSNLQRSRVVKDHINEARTQAFKLFDHKNYVSEILSRHIVKRSLKKRERL